MSARPARRVARKLGLIGAACAFGLLLGEIACRIDAFFPGQHYFSDGVRANFALRADGGLERDLEAFAAPDPNAGQSSLRPIPHPWLGWTDERTLAQVDELTRWYESAESEDAFDVLILGGSVAAEFGNVAGERFAHALLQSPKLARRPIRIWNQGHAGYKAPQPAQLLGWLLALGHQPDAVLLLDGFNDVAITESNALSRSHPQYPFFEYWSVVARGQGIDVEALDGLVEMRLAQKHERDVARTALNLGLHHSALLSRLVLVRLRSIRREFESARDLYRRHMASRMDEPALHGPHFEPGPDAVTDLALRAWVEGSRQLQAVAAAHGIPCVHVLQPTLHDKDSKPLTTEEVRQGGAQSGWQEGVARGYPRLRIEAERLRANGLSCVDATALFKTQSARRYVDVCHLNADGYAELADFIAPALIESVR